MSVVVETGGGGWGVGVGVGGVVLVSSPAQPITTQRSFSRFVSITAGFGRWFPLMPNLQRR